MSTTVTKCFDEKTNKGSIEIVAWIFGLSFLIMIIFADPHSMFNTNTHDSVEKSKITMGIYVIGLIIVTIGIIA